MSEPMMVFTEEDQNLSRQLLGKIQITGLSMVHASFSRGEALGAMQNTEIEVNGGLEINIKISNEALTAKATMKVNAVGTITKPEMVSGQHGFSIEAIIEATYAVTENDLSLEQRQRALNFILSSSAHQHIWPYWREFAQQTTNRMGIPALVAPLLVSAPPPMKGHEPIAPASKKKESKRRKPK